MCDINEKEIDQEVNAEEVEYCSSVEEQAELIALQEEIERIEVQHNPTSEASEETKNSDFYKESMTIAETVGEVFQKLLGYGVDYNNALAIASGLVQNDAGTKQLKLQATIQEQNQP